MPNQFANRAFRRASAHRINLGNGDSGPVEWKSQGDKGGGQKYAGLISYGGMSQVASKGIDPAR